MSRVEEKRKRRSKNPLLFPVGFFREVINSFKYVYKSLSMSMRRRIAFDYGLMFLISSVLTLIIFGIGFLLYEVKEDGEELLDEIYELATTKEKGFFDEEELERQLLYLSNEYQTGIGIRMDTKSMNVDPYNFALGIPTDVINNVFDVKIPTYIKALVNDRLLITETTRHYIMNDGERLEYYFVLVFDVTKPNGEMWYLILILSLSQLIWFTLISVIGSHRLKKVFRPIFAMTRTAETISISDMDAILDVSKADYELKDLAITFNEMLERIRKDYSKQKRFVSDVSHELRTPISIVNGYARMLDRWGKEDPEILEEAIDAIKGESKNMQVLVENLLTLVRSDNQTLKFEKDLFAIDELSEEILKDMEMVDEGKHRFTSDIQRPISVCLDYAKTKQTIRIFLDNAMKYTPVGGKIHMSVYAKGEYVLLRIKDTGIGVAKKDLPYLFDRFYRSDESRTRETGGHGLGLSIAKAMIIGQKGIIRVKSKEHEGSEFIIRLPKG